MNIFRKLGTNFENEKFFEIPNNSYILEQNKEERKKGKLYKRFNNCATHFNNLVIPFLGKCVIL